MYSGVDPTPEQWQGILDAALAKKLLVFFDSAYQGFASGDLDRDGYSIRLFCDAGLELLLAQSFAKNMVRVPGGIESAFGACSAPVRSGLFIGAGALAHPGPSRTLHLSLVPCVLQGLYGERVGALTGAARRRFLPL